MIVGVVVLGGCPRDGRCGRPRGGCPRDSRCGRPRGCPRDRRCGRPRGHRHI